MFEDDDDEISSSEERMRQYREKSKQEFIEGCYEAYDLLVKSGKKALDEAEVSSIQKAINRMTTFFILREEYEKCQFLKSFVKDHMPEFQITPDESIKEDLNF
jgi:ferritin